MYFWDALQKVMNFQYVIIGVLRYKDPDIQKMCILWRILDNLVLVTKAN